MSVASPADFDVFLGLVELALANSGARHARRRPIALDSEIRRADGRADKLRARLVKALGRRQHKSARVGGAVVGVTASERTGEPRLFMLGSGELALA